MTAPFSPNDAELVENRLAYAFKPPIALNRLSFDETTVTITTTKRVGLRLIPLDFLAKITLHIADRYQNIRRYAGFYSPNIQSRARKANAKSDSNTQTAEESKPIAPKWAAMLAKTFGELPAECPKCPKLFSHEHFGCRPVQYWPMPKRCVQRL